MSQEKDLHPITRKEKILDGQDLAPVTRLEYFLKKAATKGGGGGSGLPAYSSSDIGKVMTLGEGSESETATIVPEQTVTFSDEPVLLTNVNENTFQNLTPGETANAVINGVSYVATSFDTAGTVVYGVSLDPDTALFIAYSEEMKGVVLTGDAPGTYTISLTGLVHKAEPKWAVVLGLPDYSNAEENSILKIHNGVPIWVIDK